MADPQPPQRPAPAAGHRRAQAGDRLAFYYDEAILRLRPLSATCIGDQRFYSVWDKPAGLLTQGTRYADHCSLLRQAELHFQGRRKTLPVHRLDREAAGLVIVAHDPKAAAAFSKLFQEKRIEKQYAPRCWGISCSTPPGDPGHAVGREKIGHLLSAPVL